MNRLLPLLRKPWLRIGAGLVILYALSGFALLPWLLERVVPQKAGQWVQRPLSIGRIAFNPFLFELDVRDIRLTETDGRPVFGLQRLFVDFELLRSLAHWAPTLDEIRLEGPGLHLVQDPDGVLNLSRIAAGLPPEDPAAAGSAGDADPPRLIVRRVLLSAGEISFENQIPQPPVVSHADHLDLELRNLSTLPDRSGRYEIDLALPGGGVLLWKGDVSLNPVRSSGTVSVEHLKLATLWRLVEDRLAMAEPGGEMGFSARYEFSRDRSVTALRLDETVFRLKGLRLAPAASGPASVELEEFSLDPSRIDVSARQIDIPAISLRKGKVVVARDSRGGLTLQTLIKSTPSPAAPPPVPQPSSAGAASTADPPAGPWTLRLGQLRLAEIGLEYRDEHIGEPVMAGIGEFGLSLRVEASAGGAEAARARIDDIGLQLRRISLNQGKTALLGLEEVNLEKAVLEWPEQTLRIPLLSMARGKISAAMNADRQLDWQRLAPPPAASQTPAVAAPVAGEAPAAAPPWHLTLEQFRLHEVALDFADDSHKVPIRAHLGNLGLAFKLNATAGKGPPKALVDAIGLRLDQLAIREANRDDPLLAWDTLSIEGGQVDLEKQAVAIRRVALKGGGTAVTRQSSGEIHPVSLFAAAPADAQQPVQTRETPVPAAGVSAPASWKFSLGELTVNDFGVGVSDRGQIPPLAYDLDGLAVSIRDFSSPGRSPVNFSLRARVRQGGDLNVAGSATTTGDSAKANLQVDRFSLVQLQPFLSEFVKLKLDEAWLSTKLDLDFRQARPRPQVRMTGNASLASLKLTQARDGGKFLTWKNLVTQGIDFSLAPDRLSIKEVQLSEPDAVIAIHEDRSTNIGDLIRPRPTSQPPTAPVRPGARGRAPVKGPAPAGKPGPAFPVAIGRVRIDKGRMDFSDASLVLPFATRVHDLGGAIAGLALTPGNRANLKLTGRVDDYGEALVNGSLTPSNIRQFSDISVIFRNVEMTSLSPYSATFAGRKIESGKLDLDLQYRIEDSQLKSQNRIVLQQFRLGETVESKKATSLPLDLAIALLTDGEGKIQATVPVEGRLDNPQFDYGTVVWDAVTTLIKNVAMAPFNALASLMGGGEGGDPGTIAFDPGRAEIPPPEREKLEKLASSLASRPRLKLSVHGGVDPGIDTAALKTLAVRREVARLLGIALRAGELPDAVNTTDLPGQRALETLSADRTGVDGVVRAYEKETGRPPQRVGALAGLLGKPSQTPEFYDRLLAFLEAQAPVSDRELGELAERRAGAVVEELVERRRFDRTRLVRGKPESAIPTADQRVAIKLELGMD